MKVLLLNGSPHGEGCTRVALDEVDMTLQKEGIETEILHVGGENLGGCAACGGCRQTGRCVRGGLVNEVLARAEEFDGLVLGAPVHYASPAGGFVAFCDRLFFAGGGKFRNKPAAAVVSARRAGTTASLEVLQKYINYFMPLVHSQYWPMIHGASADDARKDLEGLQIMRQLGRNMAWLLKCVEAGRAAGVPDPETEPMQRTNFIR